MQHGRVELLAHPLSQKYLQMKWNSYGKYFHLTNLLVYSILLAFITLYSSLLMTNKRSIGEIQNPNSTDIINNTMEVLPTKIVPISERIEMCWPMIISGIFITIYIILASLREVAQIYQQRYQYLLEPTNLVTWLLYISVLIMVSPTWMNGYSTPMLFSAASIAVFLAWLNLLLYLQRFDQVGIYVVMFLEILQTLIKVLFIFSILIIAFGLAFFILLSEIQKQNHYSSFTTVPMSLFRTFSMMLGEIDFLDTFILPYRHDTLPYPHATFTILCKLLLKFLRMIEIILSNLIFRSLHDSDAHIIDESAYWFGCRRH